MKGLHHLYHQFPVGPHHRRLLFSDRTLIYLFINPVSPLSSQTAAGKIPEIIKTVKRGRTSAVWCQLIANTLQFQARKSSVSQKINFLNEDQRTKGSKKPKILSVCSWMMHVSQCPDSVGTILDSIDGGLTHQNTKQIATGQTLHRKVRQMNLKFLQDL